MKKLFIFFILLVSLSSHANNASWLIVTENKQDGYIAFYKDNKGRMIIDWISGGKINKTVTKNYVNEKTNFINTGKLYLRSNNEDLEYISFLKKQIKYLGVYFINRAGNIERLNLDDFSNDAIFCMKNSSLTRLKAADVYYKGQWHRLLIASGEETLVVYEILDGKLNLLWTLDIGMNSDKIEVVQLSSSEWAIVALQDNKLIFYTVDSGAEHAIIKFDNSEKLDSLLYSTNRNNNLYVTTSKSAIWEVNLEKLQLEKLIYKGNQIIQELILISSFQHNSGSGELLVVMTKEANNISLLGIWNKPLISIYPVTDEYLKRLGEIVTDKYQFHEHSYIVYTKPVNEIIDWDSCLGWSLSLNNLAIKTITDIKLVGKVLLIKLTSSMESQAAKLVILDPQTGSAPEFVVLDLNQDGQFSDQDKLNDRPILAIETSTPSIIISPDVKLHDISSSPMKIQVDPRHNRRHTWYVMPPELVP